MPGGFGRDEGNIDVCRRRDGPEANIEAVGEHQRFSLGQARLDLLVDGGSGLVRNKDHDRVGPLRGIGNGEDFQPRGPGFFSALGTFTKADLYRDTRVLQVKRVRVTL